MFGHQAVNRATPFRVDHGIESNLVPNRYNQAILTHVADKHTWGNSYFTMLDDSVWGSDGYVSECLWTCGLPTRGRGMHGLRWQWWTCAKATHAHAHGRVCVCARVCVVRTC